jgi:hypothetical protein
LILITSQEIDELGEADNMAQARLQIDGVLSHLRRGVRVLADHGIKTIVLVPTTAICLPTRSGRT